MNNLSSGYIHLVLLVFLAVGSFAVNTPEKNCSCGGYEVEIVRADRYLNFKNLSSEAIRKEKEEEIRNKNEVLKKEQNKEGRLYIDKYLRSIYSEIIKARPNLKNIVGEFDEPNNLELLSDMITCFQNFVDRIDIMCFTVAQNPYIYRRLSVISNFCAADKEIDQTMGIVVNRVCVTIPFENRIKGIY